MTTGENPKPGPPIRDRANPLALLTQYERSMRASDATSTQTRNEYNALIDLLRQRNADKGIADSLCTLVIRLNSEGAARALHGTPNAETRITIAAEVNKYLAKRVDRSGEKNRATGYVTPLALAGSPSIEEVDLLCRAARFQRGSSEFKKEDLAFRKFAVEAIAVSDGRAAQKGVLALIASVRDKVTRQSVVDAVLRRPTEGVLEMCRELLAMPRSQAIYRLAHDYQGKGGLASRLSFTIGRWRYRRVFKDLRRIVQS